MAKSNTTGHRTMAYLRKHGYDCGIVERWIQFRKIRIDFLNLFDIIACHPKKKEIIGVQTTSGTHHASHLTAMKLSTRLPGWLKSGGKAMLITWSKKGARGKRKLWTPRIVMLSLKEK